MKPELFDALPPEFTSYDIKQLWPECTKRQIRALTEEWARTGIIRSKGVGSEGSWKKLPKQSTGEQLHPYQAVNGSDMDDLWDEDESAARAIDRWRAFGIKPPKRY